MIIRALLERLSRNIALRRRLPREFGGLSLFVSPDASLRYFKSDLREIDPVLLSCAKRLVNRGDVVWDVGANVGLFAFASAGLVGKHGRVLAIEPDPWLATLLRKSVGLNDGVICTVDVLPVAVTDRSGDAVLNVARRGRATSFVSGFVPSTQTGGVRHAVVVQATTLDNLLETQVPPRVLKIDVEGAEASVLRAARKMLRNVRPRILCEVSSAHRQQVSEILSDAGYVLYDAERNWPVCEPVGQCTWNTVALPTELI